MGEHRPVRGDGPFGGVLPVAVAALFVVAAGCAVLLMVERGGDVAAAGEGGCDRLCAAAGPSGAPGGVAAATSPTHQGMSIARGSAVPPAGPGSGVPATPGGSQGSDKSASSAPATSASPAGKVVPFEVTSHWSTGYQVNVTVANDAASTVTDWSLTFRTGGTATVRQVSSANAVSGPDGTVTVTPVDWDRTLMPGQRVTVNFGFDGAYVPPAQDCDFSGQPCTLQVTVLKN